jgi:hypothetical protein
MIWRKYKKRIENIIEIVSSIEPDVAEPEKSPNNRSPK